MFEGTGITITDGGKRDLGAAIGSNPMGWEGAHCATHKTRVRATLMPGVLFACRFSMAAWLWIDDLLMAQKVFVLHAA